VASGLEVFADRLAEARRHGPLRGLRAPSGASPPPWLGQARRAPAAGTGPDRGPSMSHHLRIDPIACEAHRMCRAACWRIALTSGLSDRRPSRCRGAARPGRTPATARSHLRAAGAAPRDA
jgi:hypothetical protein